MTPGRRSAPSSRAAGSPTTAHEVFVQPHARRAQHRRLAVRAAPHVRRDRDHRHQVRHGRAWRADADFTAMLADTPPADRRSARVGRLPAAARLADEQGAAAPTLAAAAVFTVQDAPGHVRRLATSVATQPAPDADDAHAVRRGRHVAVRRRHAGARLRPPTPRSRDPRRSRCRSTSRARRPTRRRRRAAASRRRRRACGRAHRTGLLRAHGPEAQRRPRPAGRWSSTTTARAARCGRSSPTASPQLAAGTTPAAVLGFDAVEHGARKGASTKKSDDLVFNPLNPRAARDNFLQGAVDVLQALRVVGTSLACGVVADRRGHRVRSGARSRSSGTRRAARRASWRWRGPAPRRRRCSRARGRT